MGYTICTTQLADYNTHIFVHTSEIAMTTLTTRIFKNGNSQAVRIPQEFRLDVTEVEISKNENGDLVIHPVPINRGEALLAALTGFDSYFAEQLEQIQHQQPALQDRESL